MKLAFERKNKTAQSRETRFDKGILTGRVIESEKDYIWKKIKRSKISYVHPK